MKNAITLLRVLLTIVRHPLNRNRKLQALLGFTKWQVSSRLAPDGVVFKWIHDARLVVRRGDTGLTGNIYCGLQDFEDMSFMLHLLRPSDVFIDVGANLGSWTILGGKVCGASVYAFEPVPLTYRRLRDNVLINDLDGKVETSNCALGEASGELGFTSELDTMNHALSDSDIETDGIIVPVETMDRVLGCASPALIKIDVEGFELAVLKGSHELLRSRAPLAVILELNGSGRRYGHGDSALVNFMRELGFNPFRYEPASRALTPLERPGGFGKNTIFIKDVHAVQDRLTRAPRFRIGKQSF